MPVAILITQQKGKDGTKGRIRDVRTSKTITHNNRRLYHEAGKTYEYVGDDASGNRIYRDTAKVR